MKDQSALSLLLANLRPAPAATLAGYRKRRALQAFAAKFQNQS